MNETTVAHVTRIDEFRWSGNRKVVQATCSCRWNGSRIAHNTPAQRRILAAAQAEAHLASVSQES